MICEKWNIVLLPFPFTNLQAVKKRPGLIISPDEYNKSGQDVIIVFMTSRVNSEKRIGDYRIKNWQDSGLLKPTLLRMKFATIVRSIIDKRIGRLAQPDQEDFKAVLQSFILGD